MDKNEHYLLTAIDNRYRLLIEDQERAYARSIVELKEGYNGILRLQESLILRQARHILTLETRLQVEHEEEQVLPRSSLQLGIVIPPPPPLSPPLSPLSSLPPPPVPEKHKDRPRSSLLCHNHNRHHLQQQQQQYRTPEEVLDRSAKEQIAAWRRGRRDGSDGGGDVDGDDDGGGDDEWTESYDSDSGTEGEEGMGGQVILGGTGRRVIVVGGDGDSETEVTEGGEDTPRQGWDSEGRGGRRLRGGAGGVPLYDLKQLQPQLSEKGREKGEEKGREGEERRKEKEEEETPKGAKEKGPVAAVLRRIWTRGLRKA